MTVSVRASTAADLEALLAFSTSAPVSWTRPERYRQESALRHHRPEWSFLAVRDRRPVGRALWWGGADAGAPSTLDDLLVAPSDEDDRVTIAAALIRVGTASFGTVPEWIVDLAVDWHDDPEAVAAVAWRTEAARQAGLARSTERVSVAWEHPTAAIAPTTPHLRFRGGDDDEFTDLFARVTVGSLDAHTRATVAELGVRGTALDDLDFYRSLPGRREDWRVAEDDDGLVVGFVLATRTAYDAAVSYIGVLPQHRGKGIVDGLLAEALRVHTAAGEPRVVATTDADNVPMRRAFERAGATVTKRRMVYER